MMVENRALSDAKSELVILLLCVNNMLIASTCKKRLTKVKQSLNNSFKLTDLGKPKSFLSMKIGIN